MSEPLTVQTFSSLLPKNVKFNVDQAFIDEVNGLIDDETVRDTFLENMITYTSVLTEGRFTMQQYTNAIKYVSHKMFSKTNNTAYQATFPDKYNDWLVNDVPPAHISAYVSAYHNSKLVMAILAQAVIPTHLLNAGVFQDAINVQARIMNDEDVSAKVRSDAANSLLTHLKAPETKKIELDVAVSTTSAIDELRAATEQLVEQQVKALDSGATTAEQLAHSSIINQEKVINP